MRRQPPPPSLSRTPSANKSPGRSALDRPVQAEIGRLLRDAYSAVTLEPVPERFIELLEALDEGKPG